MILNVGHGLQLGSTSLNRRIGARMEKERLPEVDTSCQRFLRVLEILEAVLNGYGINATGIIYK